jgi:hypothetical protein
MSKLTEALDYFAGDPVNLPAEEDELALRVLMDAARKWLDFTVDCKMEGGRMSVPVIDSWLDEDGIHVWIQHPCTTGMAVTMLPTTWKASPSGRVEPSVHCLACGAHQFVNVTHSRWWAEVSRADGGWA